MESLLLVLIIIFLLVVLVQSAKLVESTFILIARGIKINEFFIGFVIISFITSLPEISIAITSSREIPQLSVGNMVGASTILLTLIFGLSSIKFKEIEFKGKFAEKEVLIGISSVFFMILTLLDRYISITEGILLLAYYVIYVSYLNNKFHKKGVIQDTLINAKKLYTTLGKAALGALLLIISSSLIVSAAKSLALNLDIAPSVIGIILIAVGTNIPEITILLTTTRKQKDENLTVGNIFGSLSLNPGTLGLLAILSGGIVLVDFIALVPAIVLCVFGIVLFTIFSWTGRKITKAEGFLLLGIYFSLLITELLIIIFQ